MATVVAGKVPDRSSSISSEASEGLGAIQGVSKKALKKAEKAAAKDAKKKQREVANVPGTAHEVIATDVTRDFFGFLPLCQSGATTQRKWASVASLDDTSVGAEVWLRCRIQESRCKGSLGFLQLRQRFATVQAVLDAKSEGLGKEAVRWAGSVPLESIVDVNGVVVKPSIEVTSTTQKVEIRILRIFCVSKAATELPFQLKDANRPDTEESAITVGQDVRLDNRILDLRTLANQAIFTVQSETSRLFRECLYSQGFTEIHTPKILGGASEGGADVFSFEYFGRSACLAQSPQLHKQMAICGDLDRVFEICKRGQLFNPKAFNGKAFNPKAFTINSNTHRHLCEFTGLDIEMSIKEHYNEIIDLLDLVFQHIFDGLSRKCAKEIAIIHQQHPATPFKWLSKAPRLEFAEGAKMLKAAGYDIPEDLSSFDLSTELERALGALVADKFGTDFYILTHYPTNVRPFYTMPCADDPTFSNSYDFFMRGEEILSGAQRVHDAELLIERCKSCGVPVESVQPYVDSFKLGTFPHGGCGIGLERVVMLFLGLHNIRKTSLFPRDPKRLAP